MKIIIFVVYALARHGAPDGGGDLRRRLCASNAAIAEEAIKDYL